MEKHNIVTIKDENGNDPVGDYLDSLEVASLTSLDAKINWTFLLKAFDTLSIGNLEVLCREMTQLDIMVNGQPRTKRYGLVKLLGVFPVYELRYALNGNDHLRLLFFPIEYEKQSFYVFTKVVIKTLNPNVDTTNQMRDLTHRLYLQVSRNPSQYLEVE